MSAVNKKALSYLVGYLYAKKKGDLGGYTRLASVRGLVSKNSYEQTEIKADDTGTVISFTKPTAVIECTFLENADTSIMELLLPGTRTVIAGSSTPITGEALGTGWTVGSPIKIANKNGDNSVVTNVVIDAGGSPLTDGTDYDLYVSDGSNGEKGFTYIVPLTAQTGVLDVDYDYTPNAKTEFTFIKESQEMPALEVKIEAIEDSKMRAIFLSDAKLNGDFSQSFLDVVEAGDIEGSSISFDLNDGGEFKFSDEINV